MDKCNFKEELMFNLYKDQVICNADWLRSRVKTSGVNVENLHKRIVNYQIDTYGESLYKNVKAGRDYIDTKKNIVDDWKRYRKKGKKKK